MSAWTNTDNKFWGQLLAGIHEYDQPIAKQVLLAVADPHKTQLPTEYIMSITRAIMAIYIPSYNIDGFVESVVSFVKENFEHIDVGNKLDSDKEASSMVDIVERYLTEVNYGVY